jgi:hypothetical protein
MYSSYSITHSNEADSTFALAGEKGLLKVKSLKFQRHQFTQLASL